jgi:hypothetical protein
VCGTAVNNCGQTVTCGPATQPCTKCGTQACAGGVWGACTGQGACNPGDSQPCNCSGSQNCNGSCQWGACSAGSPDFNNDKENCGSCDYCCASGSVNPACPGTGNAYQCKCGQCFYIPPGNCNAGTCGASQCADSCKQAACIAACGQCY